MEPEIGVGAASQPDREERGRGHAEAQSEHRAAHHGQQARRGQASPPLGPGGAQRPEGGVVASRRVLQARGRLADRDEPGQPGDEREEPQRRRDAAHRRGGLLERRLTRQARVDLDAVVGDRVRDLGQRVPVGQHDHACPR